MFKRYMNKFSNTIGTVNYLQKVTKENSKSTIHTRSESSDDDNDNTSSTNVLTSTPDIILSTAIAELRNTLLFYTLVFWNVLKTYVRLNFFELMLCLVCLVYR